MWRHRYSGGRLEWMHLHLVGRHRCLPPASLPCLQVMELPDNPRLEGTCYWRMVRAPPMVCFRIHLLSISAPQSWLPFSRGTFKSATWCSSGPGDHDAVGNVPYSPAATIKQISQARCWHSSVNVTSCYQRHHMPQHPHPWCHPFLILGAAEE